MTEDLKIKQELNEKRFVISNNMLSARTLNHWQKEGIIEDDRPKVDELYNLENDIGEQNNLAEQFPEKVAELKALMKSIEAQENIPGGPTNPAGKKPNRKKPGK